MEPRGERFRHEALLFEDVDRFVTGVAGFVRDGLAAGEAVLVAVARERERVLREELGADGARVRFVPMAEAGRNPARIIPMWWDWLEQHAARNKKVRGVGEPAWVGRSEAALAQCLVHERLLNTAFDQGPGWRLLCPYDAALPEWLLRGVVAAHPALVDGAVPAGSAAFAAAGGSAAFEVPLPDSGAPLFEVEFGVDGLPVLRAEIRARADRLGLAGRAVGDFVLVADELASNSIRHGGGRGWLGVWAWDGYAVCEVRDAGLIRDPLVGRRRPDLRAAEGGAGLWTANQLCDLLLIHSTPATGTAVRAYLPTR